ncbi:DUF5671 domain-containing protein [Microbacterium cremeum]|uniref:DUF5671 domain-containing protein n=1 Tax=Microbacterium cremeum TaxID=2782169 RepID=UPI001E5EA85E|nr:DUF5671 domain-containing protein [Microbacterium cremeum]
MSGSPPPAASAGLRTAAPHGRGAQAVIRRIILFALLFALVTIAASGLSGLLERAIGAGGVLVDTGAGLALALAFALIGAPLAAVLWWWLRRRLADPFERASLVWALYLTAMTLTALIVATLSLGSAAAAGVDGRWRPGELATGLVWAGVWLWHRQMRRNAASTPTRLVDVPVSLSALFGLVVAASGAVSALAALLSEALSGVAPVLIASEHWAVPVLRGLVWLALGALEWWWHWFREGARRAPGAFAAVLLVIVIGASAATALFSLGTVVFVLLRVLFDTDPLAEVLAPMDVAVSAVLVGAFVWVYHASVLAARSERVRGAGRLVVSAIALIGAASGFGVVVNALLAAVGPALVDDDPRTLLLGGISALVVGVPAWVIAWRPARTVTTADAADPARRVYLIVVFGASAVVGLVTLLIIGYRLFEFLLDAGGAAGLLERIRAPLGLLSATAVVFGYHFAIWRRDRALAPAAAPPDVIGRVILVAGDDADELARRIRSATGAAVTVWRAAAADGPTTDADAAAVVHALDGLAAARVLVVTSSGGAPQVVPLAD